MSKNKFNANNASLSVDLSEARQAVKENRFQDALDLFEIILKDDSDHIDSLYLAAVSSRYLKNFDESKSYLGFILSQPWTSLKVRNGLIDRRKLPQANPHGYLG